MRYEIRVKGVLDQHWVAWFDGLDVDVRETDTVIHGPLADQSALFGVLARIHDLGLTLMSVSCLDTGPS
jgi:hypothetical protein